MMRLQNPRKPNWILRKLAGMMLHKKTEENVQEPEKIDEPMNEIQPAPEIDDLWGDGKRLMTHYP